MKYIAYEKIDKTYKFLGFYDDNIHKHIPKNCIAISDELHEEMLSSNKTTFKIISNKVVLMEKPAEDVLNEKLDIIRGHRNHLINESLWLIQRHRDELELGITTTLSKDKYIEVLTYIQSLRDLPKTCDVNNPVFPILNL